MIGALDEAIDNAAFTESFLVRFLGSMEVKQDRGKYKQHLTHISLASILKYIGEW